MKHQYCIGFIPTCKRYKRSIFLITIIIIISRSYIIIQKHSTACVAQLAKVSDTHAVGLV